MALSIFVLGPANRYHGAVVSDFYPLDVYDKYRTLPDRRVYCLEFHPFLYRITSIDIHQKQKLHGDAAHKGDGEHDGSVIEPTP